MATFSSGAVDPEGLRCSPLFHSQFIPQSPQAFLLLPPSVDALPPLSHFVLRLKGKMAIVVLLLVSRSYGNITWINGVSLGGHIKSQSCWIDEIFAFQILCHFSDIVLP